MAPLRPSTSTAAALFSKADLELLRNIADSAALSIENARLYAELAASYDGTLDALTAALDLRDRATEGHSRRVVEYTARLARQMGLPEAEISNICRGALIHDIGKIGVPDSILLKPGLLDPDERRIMEKHPVAGYEMLLGVPYLAKEIPIVLAHQEHWDGTGYPFGLVGDEIPLGARLFAIADTFDAADLGSALPPGPSVRRCPGHHRRRRRHPIRPGWRWRPSSTVPAARMGRHPRQRVRGRAAPPRLAGRARAQSRPQPDAGRPGPRPATAER